ncbi:MAG: hypothetical protein ACI4OJ_00310 [Lachnospiraceae bacterium]
MRKEDTAAVLAPTREEREASALLDQKVLDTYPLVANEYAPLASLEQKMMEPTAFADRAAWEKMTAERDQLEDAFWAAMKSVYGINRPAVRKRRRFA